MTAISREGGTMVTSWVMEAAIRARRFSLLEPASARQVCAAGGAGGRAVVAAAVRAGGQEVQSEGSRQMQG
jgi:hypothetical protein